MSRETTDRRLRADGLARLEADEEIIAWCRAWVSRSGRLQRLAPRWRDVAMVTDRRLLLFGVGHFTRRPRRRVLADRLDELTVSDVGARPGRGLRCAVPGRPAMLLELDGDAWSRRFGSELQERAREMSTAERLIETATMAPRSTDATDDAADDVAAGAAAPGAPQPPS